MAANRRNGRGLRTGGGQPAEVPHEDVRLPLWVAIVDVLRKLSQIGMIDGQLQVCAGRCVPRDQAAIVELGGSRSDSADQSDMHGTTFRCEPAESGRYSPTSTMAITGPPPCGP